MRQIKVTAQPVQDPMDDETVDHVVELILKGFPDAVDIASWISETANVFSEDIKDKEVRTAVMDLISIMAGSLLSGIIEAETEEDEAEAAVQFIDQIKGTFFKKRKAYLKLINAMEESYMSLECDCTPREAKTKFDRFDALREVGKLIEGKAA